MNGWKIWILNGVVFLDIENEAFESINHDILTNKMNEHFGIIGVELNWFNSYQTKPNEQRMAIHHQKLAVSHLRK